jgi:hypothetical protein
MACYITRKPRADDEGYYYSPPLITNIEVTETGPQWTGLLDSDGNEICRMNDPIGFQFD